MSTVLEPRAAAVPGFPRDQLFDLAAREGLVWLPELGMGRLWVREAPYTAEYFAKYEGYAATEQGRRITAARVDIVLRHAGTGPGVVDVGIGCGAFISAWPGRVEGCDINPAGVAWLEERGLFRDPRAESARVLTFWDVLEHLSEPREFIAAAKRWVFMSIPIVPGNYDPPPPGWKHTRADEHAWYWNRNGLIRWMAEQGFECVEHGTPESLVGREDIHTFVFRRTEHG